MTREEFIYKFCSGCEYSYRIPGFLYPQCGLEGNEPCPYAWGWDDDGEEEDDEDVS